MLPCHLNFEWCLLRFHMQWNSNLQCQFHYYISKHYSTEASQIIHANLKTLALHLPMDGSSRRAAVLVLEPLEVPHSLSSPPRSPSQLRPQNPSLGVNEQEILLLPPSRICCALHEPSRQLLCLCSAPNLLTPPRIFHCIFIPFLSLSTLPLLSLSRDYRVRWSWAEPVSEWWHGDGELALQLLCSCFFSLQQEVMSCIAWRTPYAAGEPCSKGGTAWGQVSSLSDDPLLSVCFVSLLFLDERQRNQKEAWACLYWTPRMLSMCGMRCYRACSKSWMRCYQSLFLATKLGVHCLQSLTVIMPM
jgi:hypothetical protein